MPRGGALACVNAFGTGIADDKLVHAYVEEMVRFYLGEEPRSRSVPTYDPGEPSVRAAILERMDELVVKPRDGYGGEGVVVCAARARRGRGRAARLRPHRPDAYVAQETVMFSTHPTVVEGALAPRHVDLRPFAFATARRCAELPGGLTRVALDAGALVVNSSQNGGGKATGCSPEAAREPRPLIGVTTSEVRRSEGVAPDPAGGAAAGRDGARPRSTCARSRRPAACPWSFLRSAVRRSSRSSST